MKKIIGIAAAALMSLSLFACDASTTKTTRTRVIEDVPYSTTRVVRRTDSHNYKAPRILTPKTVKYRNTVDAPNLLPYVMNDTTTNYRNYNAGTRYNTTQSARTVRNAVTPYNVNN